MIMKRHFKPMLAAAILSAAACSPIDDPTKNSTDKEGELTISVSTEEPTRGMITESVLPNGSLITTGTYIWERDMSISTP